MVVHQSVQRSKAEDGQGVKYVPSTNDAGGEPGVMVPPGRLVTFKSRNSNFSNLFSVLALFVSMAFFLLVLSWLWGVPESVQQNKVAIGNLKKIVDDQAKKIVDDQATELDHLAKGGEGESRTAEGPDCNAKPDPGFCRAAFLKWYFDKDSQKCKEFTYGGCNGNSNRFETEKECESKCGGKGVKKPERNPDCFLAKEMGRCRALFDRFFFNPSTGKCEDFVYGGCEGNGNNFETLEQCKSTCGEGSPEVGEGV